ERIVETALQEDVDVIALSILSGAHMTIFPRILELMRERELEGILVTGGGIIAREDMTALQEMGTGRLFGPGTRMQDIVDYIRGWAAERETQPARP
ncbi:MAG: cobalamin-dependent protein, partial [Gemmatimonadota bacterium]